MAAHDEVADRARDGHLLGLELGRPILFGGRGGRARPRSPWVLSAMLGSRLIRLQCYEGSTSPPRVYERGNLPRQMLRDPVARGAWRRRRAPTIFGSDFPASVGPARALESADGAPPVLLIDEIDRADEELEAHLILSDFQ
ncbi:MAG: hypothetical protein R3C32_06700 [Chloroflexota bacterium]